MKKIISLMILVMLLIMNVGVCAAEEETYQNGDWIYSSETDKIVKWAGTGSDVVIPENSVVDVSFVFNPKGLYSVAEGGYVAISSLMVSENVTIEGSMNLSTYENFKEIEFYNNSEQMPKISLLFHDMESLTTLRLPEGLTEIQAGMCNGCIKLKDLYIPDTVETIGKNAFYNCDALTSFSFPSRIKSVGENVLHGCNAIKSISFPKGLDYSLVFVSSALEKADFEEMPEFTRDFYYHFSHTAWMQNEFLPTIKGDFVIIGSNLVKYKGNDKSVTIPSEVKIIDESAFYESDITDVTIHNNITEIGSTAFGKCTSLKEVTIPASVKTIKDSAFYDCTALEKVIIEGDCMLYDHAFAYCESLTDEGINLIGNVTYATDDGVEVNPWAFTNTNYNEGYLDWINSQTPIVTEEPTEIPTEKSTSEPTEEPTEAPTEEPGESATTEPVGVLKVTPTEDGIAIETNGEKVDFGEEQPFIDDNDRTQIPIRAVAETLGCGVDWNGDEQIVTLTKNNISVIIKIGSTFMQVDKDIITMDTTAQIINDRTYIPVRFVGEALGLKVQWINE